MSLSDYHPVFNTSVKFRQAIELDQRQVVAFLSEVTNQLPELSEYRKAEEGYHLVERRAGRLVRQILVSKDEITMAVAPPLDLSAADETSRIIYPLISERVQPSPLLITYVDVAFRFEFPYAGNHDRLVLQDLFSSSPFARIAAGSKGAVRDFQPTLSLSLSDDHSIVAAIEIRTRTTEREIISGVFDGDPIQIVCGIAKVKNLARESLVATYASVYEEGRSFLEHHVLESLVDGLKQAVTGERQ